MILTIYTLFNEFPLVFAQRVAISLAAMLGLIFGVYWLYKRNKIDKKQFIVSIFLSVYFVIMLYFVVMGRYSHSFYRSQTEIFALHRRLITSYNRLDLYQLVVNIAMFIPVGFLLPLIIKRRHKYILTLSVSLLLTLMIEVTQYFSRTGTFELDDIFNNFIGAVVGVVFFKIYESITSSRVSRR